MPARLIEDLVIRFWGNKFDVLIEVVDPGDFLSEAAVYLIFNNQHPNFYEESQDFKSCFNRISINLVAGLKKIRNRNRNVLPRYNVIKKLAKNTKTAVNFSLWNANGLITANNNRCQSPYDYIRLKLGEYSCNN